MGFFDKLKKRGNKKIDNVDNEKLNEKDNINDFKENIKKASEINLTPEQLREKLFELIAVNDRLKKMPMVKEKILSELESIELRTVEDVKKSIESIYVSKDGKYMVFPNENDLMFTLDEKEGMFFISKTEKWKERDIESMFSKSGTVGTGFATFQKDTSYIYNMNTGIEIARTISRFKNGDKVLECNIYRDDIKINKAIKLEKYICDPQKQEEKEEIDLTQRPHDIATLDGVEANQIERVEYQRNLNTMYRLEDITYATDYEKVYQKILKEKINESKNKEGCYKYMGISQPTVQPAK